MSQVLDKIKQPNDIKKIDPKDYDALAGELRREILSRVSKNGGHLASNLGVVELTMALHLALDFPQDKLIWDVGHQAYVHKLLTGRRDAFKTLRTLGGMSGFPKRKESDCDAFDTGHSSTSISAALGCAMARDLAGENYTVAAVIGDGAMTGGVAMEALNNVSRLKSNLIIVLNDNEMSISENVGGLSSHLSLLRTQESYINFKQDIKTKLKRIPRVGDTIAKNAKASKDQLRSMLVRDGLFGDFGVKYVGPVNGHDVEEMVRVLKAIKKMDEPVLLHVLTKKGKGYRPAEQRPADFHGIGSFDLKTGKAKKSGGPSYTSVFSKTLLDMAGEDEKIAAVCAAMPDGTGLTAFKEKYPERFFDVGIAEQHAVTFAAGMASAGIHPVVAVYSSFMQRAFDQVIHDVCIQDLPVIFALDRAGLVGADGETHQGIFDLSYMSMIPNMTVCAPMNAAELEAMLRFAGNYDKPITLRYPRGEAWTGGGVASDIVLGKGIILKEGSDIALIGIGSMVQTALETADLLENYGIHATVVNARFMQPVDEELLLGLAGSHKLLVTLEENVKRGGFGEYCARILSDHQIAVPMMTVAIPDDYVEHGSVAELRKILGMNPEQITDQILKTMGISVCHEDKEV